VDLLRRPVLESGVPTLRIVPEFDVPDNVTVRMIASRILGTVNPLVLQCSEERLRHRIIVAYPGAAGGLAEAMLLQRRRELTGIRLELRSALPAGLPLRAVPGLLSLATQRNWTAARLGVTLRDQ
jgi:hypothetical protein